MFLVWGLICFSIFHIRWKQPRILNLRVKAHGSTSLSGSRWKITTKGEKTPVGFSGLTKPPLFDVSCQHLEQLSAFPTNECVHPLNKTGRAGSSAPTA